MLIPLALLVVVLLPVLWRLLGGRSTFPRLERGDRPNPSPFVAAALSLWVVLGLSMGWGLATLSDASFSDAVLLDPVLPVAAETEPQSQPPYTTVDFVPERYQLGQKLYLKNCATCHIAVPPQVLPSETWRNLIQDQSHYGTELEPLREPSRSLIWSYLRYASRQKSNREERTPYRVDKSQYFRALHPRVELPRPTSLDTCLSCHPAAPNFNFRQLVPDWVKTP